MLLLATKGQNETVRIFDAPKSIVIHHEEIYQHINAAEELHMTTVIPWSEEGKSFGNNIN